MPIIDQNRQMEKTNYPNYLLFEQLFDIDAHTYL